MTELTAHPLGPLVVRLRHPRPWRFRLVLGALLLACIGVVALAAWLRPDERGVGTHEQLGFPPCTMVRVAGMPCPTCGMTTAFANVVRGRLSAAFVSQPFGLLLAVAMLLAVPLFGEMIVTAKTWQVNWYRLSPNRFAAIVLALFLLSWVFKIAYHLARGA